MYLCAIAVRCLYFALRLIGTCRKGRIGMECAETKSQFFREIRLIILLVHNELQTNYADLIREVLDYRDWYEFLLFYQPGWRKQKRTDEPGFQQIQRRRKGNGHVRTVVRFRIGPVPKGG